ncbi:MAG: enoyl-[acyl-carrier-protein] reductase FabK [Bacillota bacterium]
MIKSKVCELLGIKYPLFQGGMAWVADGKLAGAVSKAGGLGIIAAGGAPVEWVKQQIDIVRSITDNNFAVNIMLMSPTAPDVANLVCTEKVPVVTTGAGSPAKYIQMWKEHGIKVVPVVPSSSIAKRMERAGADAVIAEGMEGGGHVGELTTMALIPQVVDAVSIPVIAAGGIADGRGAAAAFMLGAEAIQVGTRFLSAIECGIHENYKQMVLSAKDTDTIITGRSTGHPVRALKNKFTKQMQTLDIENKPEEIEAKGGGALRIAVQVGDLETGSFMAGQIVGMVDSVQSCDDIIKEIISECEDLLLNTGGHRVV